MDPWGFDSQVMLIMEAHVKCIRCVLVGKRRAHNYSVYLIPNGCIKTPLHHSLITYRQLSTKLLSSAGTCGGRESQPARSETAGRHRGKEGRSCSGLIAKCIFG